METGDYKYVIVGGGLAGASAVEGIRERDKNGSILLIGAENELPYNRPPLSKGLWTGKDKQEAIFVHGRDFYRDHGVSLHLGAAAARIDRPKKSVLDSSGTSFHYERLLLATGGTPGRLQIPGGELSELVYLRTLADFRRTVSLAGSGRSALVIGGGFIGSEMAAALTQAKLKVTLLFTGDYLCHHVFPEELGRHITHMYSARGVNVIPRDNATSIRHEGGVFITRTRTGQEIRTDLVVAGIGIQPNEELARAAGLTVADGVEVNTHLQTSDAAIYAAGDVACFPDPMFGRRRMEHWDNAQAQGRHAGRNMAGADQPFTDMPFFFADLFDFGYEGVGEVDGRLETFADWQEPNRTGVVYYLRDDRVRGVMMCNVWEKVDAARALIARQEKVPRAALRGAIK